MILPYIEAHPEYEITWDIGVCGEGDAASIVKNDPAAAADVFFYANDQMGTLIEAGALSKLGGSYLETVQNNFSQTHVDLLTYTDGGVYGLSKEEFANLIKDFSLPRYNDIPNVGLYLEQVVKYISE